MSVTRWSCGCRGRPVVIRSRVADCLLTLRQDADSEPATARAIEDVRPHYIPLIDLLERGPSSADACSQA